MHLSQVGLLVLPQSQGCYHFGRFILALSQQEMLFMTAILLHLISELNTGYWQPYLLLLIMVNYPARIVTVFLFCSFLGTRSLMLLGGSFRPSVMRLLLYPLVEDFPLWESRFPAESNFWNRDYKFIKWFTGSNDKKDNSYFYDLVSQTHAFTQYLKLLLI